MKHIKKYLCLALLLGSAGLIADCSTGSCTTPCGGPKTVLPLIMQLGSNLYTQYHKPFYSTDEDDCGKWMADLSVTYRYGRTYGGCETIAPLLFGSNSLNFIGTTNNPNDGTALIADYFGLAQDTNATLKLNPKITDNVVDFQFAAGGKKLWFQINVPVMHAKYRLGDCATETGDVSGAGLQDAIDKRAFFFTQASTTPKMIAEAPTSGDPVATNQDFNAFPVDQNGSKFTVTTTTTGYSDTVEFAYMGSPALVDSTGAAIDITTAYKALVATNELSQDGVDSASTLKEALSGFTFGDLASRKYNKFNFDTNSCSGKWKVADIQLILGYDFCKNECHHMGAYVKAVIPTGTEINEDHAAFVFQPLIGNGRHFELGAGLTGHMELWNCDDKSLDLNMDGYLTHMFKKSSFRTFDLLNKPMTRYALMKKLVAGVDAEDAWGYDGELVVAGDINAQCVDVTADVRGEAVVDLVYSACDWQVGLGYSFSGKTKEKFDCKASCAVSDSTRYGLKGNTGTGQLLLENNNNAGVVATANTSGYNTIGALDTVSTPNIPYPRLAVKASNSIDDQDMYNFTDGGLAADDADNADLYSLPCPNRSGLMEGQILNKIFAHVDYTWSDNCWMPTLGVVGSVSFSPDSNRTAKFWDLGARLGCSF